MPHAADTPAGTAPATPRKNSVEYRKSRQLQTVGYGWKGDHRVDPRPDPSQLSSLPDAPCFRCGDRGYCDHRSAA